MHSGADAASGAARRVPHERRLLRGGLPDDDDDAVPWSELDGSLMACNEQTGSGEHPGRR
jgi:hypothetical protein